MHSRLWRARTAAVLMAVAALAGCADSEPIPEESPASEPDPAPTSPATASPGATENGGDEVQAIEVEITDRQALTDRSRVDVAVGTVVRIEARADVDEEIHVHGYDLSAPVSPAEPAVLEFTADIPGVFEVEAEHSGLLLFQLRVR